MFWKRNLRPIRGTRSEGENDLFSRLKKEITPLRPQGDPPLRDSGSFSRYTCELCATPAPLAELKQCVLCGRWACSSCWTSEYYVCNACNGILQLHLLHQSR
ncbi:MAG: hypothetical protein QCH35_01870 [Methanomicrobiaceae archaeon]|nr:hypothetical protein [Methanomicrobiaceae archaeon]